MSDMRTRVLLALGLLFLAGGLLLGFLPRTAGGVHCGSAFHNSNDAVIQDYAATKMAPTDTVSADTLVSVVGQCEAARTTTRTPAYVLLLVGSVLTVSGLVVRRQHDQTDPARV